MFLNLLRKMLGIFYKGILIVMLCIIFLLVAMFAVPKFLENKNYREEAFLNNKNIQFQEIDRGEEIAYIEYNNNATQTLLFVGGLSAWSGTWQKSLDNLKGEDYNLIAIDLPPFGFSNIESSANFDRKTQSERIVKFIENKKLNHLILISHSYGAGPSAEAVINSPEYFDKFIIIDGVLNIDENKVSPEGLVSKLLFNDTLRNLVIGFFIHLPSLLEDKMKTFVYIKTNINRDLLNLYTASFDVKDSHKKLSKWLLDYSKEEYKNKSNLSENYKNINLPVRIIWGDKDDIVTIDLADKITGNVKDGKLYSLQNIGHIPMIEDFDYFIQTLKVALKE